MTLQKKRQNFWKRYLCTQCDLKITELFSYRIKEAWYYVSKLIFIQNRIHLTYLTWFLGCSLAPVSQLVDWWESHRTKLLALQFSVLETENRNTVIDQANTEGG